MPDVLDIRDLANQWRDEGDPEDVDARYVELCEQLNIDPTPDALEQFGDQYEPTLLAEGYFTQYAQDLAELPNTWPYRHIDWDAAADAISVDYKLVTFDGDCYYMRKANNAA